jgi:UDP-N-acetylglucosamine--N-acetylmuramyl-(pentapeptide) pyrophosphoryl-undecaprenol N-acetylglucosamine transferase
MPDTLHILFAGGGTAGHLVPGLAVAQTLVRRAPGSRLTFVGSGKPRERELVAAAGFDYRELPCAGRPAGLGGWLKSAWKNACGLAGAWGMLRAEPFHAVVGLGGYASLPAAQSAAWLGLPLVLLEQNVLPGRATRWLAAAARVVCTAFEATRDWLPAGCRLAVTGNPVRSEIVAARRVADQRQLVVLGGSGGAAALNRAVPAALSQLAHLRHGWQVVHQSGEAECQATRERYQAHGITADVRPFIHDMPQVLANSDLAISRAGGTTLAELAALGLPAILVPFPHAADNHQRLNAQWAACQGGCLLVDERPSEPSLERRLSQSLAPLLVDAVPRQRMAQAMRRLARPTAADEVAGWVLGLRS